MKKRMVWIAIILVSIAITLGTLVYEDSYVGVTGWVCGESASEKCYEELSMWGFPLPYLWDYGMIGMIGERGVEDIEFYYKTPLYFTLNVMFYIFVIAIFSRLVLRKKFF